MALALAPATRFQQIDGFGVGLHWVPAISDAQADLAFTLTGSGIGLSFARVGFDMTGALGGAKPGNEATAHAEQIINATKATARGVRMFGICAEAQASWFTPATLDYDGWGRPMGTLDPTHYADFADLMAGAAATMATDGLPVWGLGFNEPDGGWLLYFDSITLHVFVRDYLWPRMKAQCPGVRPMVADVAAWANLGGYVTEILSDAPADLKAALIASSHGYAGVSAPVEAVTAAGVPTHETEYTYPASPAAFDASMVDGVRTAKRIHGDIVTGNASAWNYFVLWPGTDLRDGVNHNFGLWHPDTQVPGKKFWALGNYSKFIRPNARRFSCTGAPAGVYATAYQNANGGPLALVLVNDTASPVALDLSLVTGSVTGWTPYVTDATRDLAEQAAVGAAAYTLPATSVVTLVSIGLAGVEPIETVTLVAAGSADLSLRTAAPTVAVIPAGVIDVQAGAADFSLRTAAPTVSIRSATPVGTGVLRLPNGTDLAIRVWDGAQWVDTSLRFFDGSSY